MRKGDKAQERSGQSTSVRTHHDIVMRIIFFMPLKFLIKCKLLSRNFKGRIFHREFSKTLFQRQKVTTIQLIYLVDDGRFIRKLPKIFFNPIIAQSVTMICLYIVILGSWNGLILFEFEKIRCYYVFNPLTRERQLIPYLNAPTYKLYKQA